jgi:PAS domain S-box-containing protein
MTNPDFRQEALGLDDLLGKDRSPDAAQPDQRGQKSQMETAAIFYLSPEDFFFWHSNRDGKVIGGNPSWQDFTGQSPEESRDCGWLNAVHPDDRERTLAGWREALTKQTNFQIQYRVLRRDGVYRHVISRGVPVSDQDGQIVEWIGTCIDIDNRKRTEMLVAGQKHALELAASGSSLSDVLEVLTDTIEARSNGEVLASVLLLDADGTHLRHCAGSSLPASYIQIVDGVEIGPTVGSCGTAAWRGQTVIVSDTATDPLWADYRDLAHEYGLRACWSTPIISSKGKVLGTFALYYREVYIPTPEDQEIVVFLTHTAAVFIEREIESRNRLAIEASLRESKERLELALSTGAVATWVWDVASDRLTGDERLSSLFDCDPQELASGLPLSTFTRAMHEEDRPRVEALIASAVEEGEECNVEYRVQSADGQIHWVAARARVERDAAGQAIRFPGALLDLTERKQSETALRESRGRLKMAMQAALIYTWEMNLATQRFEWSDNVAQVIGFDLPSTFTEVLEFIHPDDREEAERAAFQVFGGRESYEAELRLINPTTGEITWIKAQGIGTRAQDEQPCFSGLTQNITAQKRAEEAIREREEQFRLLFEKSADAILIADDDGNYLGANQAACEMLGYTPEQLLKMKFADLTVDHSDHGEMYRAYLEKGQSKGEISYLRPDGERRVAQYNAARIAPGRHLSILRDITAERLVEIEREHRYRDAMKLNETNRALVGAFELKQVTAIICRAARELTGADGATFAVRDGEMVRYLDENATQPLWKGQEMPLDSSISGWTIRTGRHAVIDDIYNDGRINPANYQPTFVQSLATMPIGSGNPIAAIGVYWSRRFHAGKYEIELLQSLASAADLALAGVRAYNEARSARTEVELANRLKDEFLAALSLELRNPLNTIVGNAEILLRAQEAKQSKFIWQVAETIRRNSMIQAQVINDLLDLSRLQANKLVLNPQVIDLAPLISEAVQVIGPEAEAKRILLDVNLSNEPVMVNADAARIQQIAWNLLANAIKFTPGGGRIFLSLARNNREAVLVVEDTGQGIEPDLLPYIFDIFRQADVGGARRQSGMGIGLALVRQLVELHGGRVEARSVGVGRGARLIVRLPIFESDFEDAPPPGDGALRGVRILLVDDTLDSLNALSALLQSEGAHVVSASSGAEALNIARISFFDLLLSDILMPGMDGYEMLKRLRAIPTMTNIPAIAITGFGRPEDVEKARAAGFTRHITKPLNFEELLEKAKAALHQKG